MSMESKRYKLFGIVTNIAEKDMTGGKTIDWLHKRCGKSEAIHAFMKDDLAGGTLPSGDFGANAAWWGMMILALNLNVIMKKIALDRSMASSIMKAVRFAIINIPGRIIKRSRGLILRLSKDYPAFYLLVEARQRIARIQPASG